MPVMVPPATGSAFKVTVTAVLVLLMQPDVVLRDSP